MKTKTHTLWVRRKIEINTDPQQRYVDHFEACSWQHAEDLARQGAGESLLVAGTVEGKLVSLDNMTYGYE